ncbi:MAG: hypothetical protein ABEH61_02090 [Haloarculaceae archaeon]
MDTWIDRIQCERGNPSSDESIKIEGGFDSFERIDIRESEEDESDIHIFKIEKKSEIFDITINWAVDPEGEEYSEEELKEKTKNRIRTASSYQASHYLESMDLPPLQSLFAEEMSLELVPSTENSDDS